jgi:cell wall-associated NlpC family hydrolase
VRANFHSVPDYSNEEFDKLDYLLLRKHDGWSNFVSQGIQSGDLVFYHDTSRSEVWSHVAIVIDGSGHTNYVLRAELDGTNMQEPYIAEHDGPLPQGDGIRTMGDTATDT